MHAAVIAARVALAIVFGWSAMAKLARRDATAAAAEALSVPAATAVIVARMLVPIEAAVAALVVIPATAIAGAAGALVLILVFSAALARTLRSGRRPLCYCFGSLSRRPIGPDTLVRNAALGALAVVAFAGSR